MRKIAIGLTAASLALLVPIPLFFMVVLYISDSGGELPEFIRTHFDDLAAFGRGIYFTLLPGVIMLGLSIVYRGRLLGTGKKTFSLADIVWASVFSVSAALYILAYSAGPGSFFLRGAFELGGTSPGIFLNTILLLLPGNIQAVILWQTLFLMIICMSFLFESAGRIGFDKKKFGGLMIGCMGGFVFSLFLRDIPLFTYLEESFISVRYSWSAFFTLRNPGTTTHETGLPYCQPPADISGQQIVAYAPNPPGVRDDIEIIGISNKTIEELRGDWPLDWAIYATLADRMTNAENNVLLFDISFLDEKGYYGANYCNKYIQCTPMGDYKLRRQVDILAESIARSKTTIVSDYPMETTDEEKASISNYEKRLEVLRTRERLKNIHNGRYAASWGAKLPLPPVEQLSRALDGIGYANIVKNEYGLNRQVPLVLRIMNEKRAMEPDYNPDVDDDYYPGIDLVVTTSYFGVNTADAVEVDWLHGWVKIKNIPEKAIQKFNLEKGEMETVDILGANPPPDRTIVIPINRFGLMNINFRGGRYCFKYREILETSRMDVESAAATYKNKIALVAMYYATGVGTAKDMHLSPYGDMAGIEHHAYALNTILNRDFAYDAKPWVNLIILLVIGLIMGFYQPRVPTWMSFILAVVIAVSYILITMLITFGQYSYLHVFPTVIFEQFVILVGFIGFRALTEEENVKFIRNTFSKFVSQDVVDELLANPEAIALGGAKKEITVFFSDVRGFTTISEKLGPEDLVGLLNEYLSEMTELIIEYRGTIDKYMGDAIMAFWGAPAKNDDHAYYTCVAAVAQYRALQELQKHWSTRDIPVLDIGIGINTGLAVVGNMGSSRRMDYTLMGDTVNLGSRLEGITKTYGVKICISEYTYERVKSKVYARELDLVRVKGKLEPVRIYELMGLREESDLKTFKTSHLHAKAAS